MSTHRIFYKKTPNIRLYVLTAKMLSIINMPFMLTICYTMNDSHAKLNGLVNKVLIPGQQLTHPKRVIANLYQNICCSVLLCNVFKSSWNAIADSTWV